MLLLLDTNDDLGDKMLPKLLSLDDAESDRSRDILCTLLEGDKSPLLKRSLTKWLL